MHPDRLILMCALFVALPFKASAQVVAHADSVVLSHTDQEVLTEIDAGAPIPLDAQSNKTVAWRTGMGFLNNASSRPAEPLSGSQSMWFFMRFRHLKDLDIALSLRKDAFEPMYTSARPWYGPESKRATISYSHNKTNTRIILGFYRLEQGFALQTGSLFSRFISMSNPTAPKGHALRIRPAHAGAPFPRKGMVIQWQVIAGLELSSFTYSSVFPVSLDSFYRIDGTKSTWITGTSKSSRFTSQSMIDRRNGLVRNGKGVAMVLQRKWGSLSFISDWFEVRRARTPEKRSPSGTEYSMFFNYKSTFWDAATEFVSRNGKTQDWVAAFRLFPVQNMSVLARIMYSSPDNSVMEHAFSTYLASFSGSSGNRSAQNTEFSIATRYRPSSNSVITSGWSTRIRYTSSEAKKETTRTAFFMAEAPRRKAFSVRQLFVFDQQNLLAFDTKNRPLSSVRSKTDIKMTVPPKWVVGVTYAAVRTHLPSPLFTVIALTASWQTNGWKVTVQVADGHQAGGNNKQRAYFGAPNITGLFPLGSISGNAASTIAMLSYSRSRLKVELSFSDTASKENQSGKLQVVWKTSTPR